MGKDKNPAQNKSVEYCAEPIYRIHPAIGIARAGYGTTGWFIGPMDPEVPVTPPNGFKPSAKQINRQAAMFQIFRYTKQCDETGWRWQQLSMHGVKQIRWKVTLANTKGHIAMGATTTTIVYDVKKRKSFFVHIDRRSKKESWAEIKAPKEVRAPSIPGIGEIHLGFVSPSSPGQPGKLLVIGSDGKAYRAGKEELKGFRENTGWWDSMSDGPVEATIIFDEKEKPEGHSKNQYEALASWVVVAPPDFAPRARSVITLYDLLFDKFAAGYNAGKLIGGSAAHKIYEMHHFYARKHYYDERQDVTAVLRAARDSAILAYGEDKHAAFFGAESSAGFASAMKTLLYNAVATIPNRMPKLRVDENDTRDKRKYTYGAECLRLTETQLKALGSWAGALGNSALKPKARGRLEFPAALDRAALESCSGGGLHPGIEVSSHVKSNFYLEPFRIDLKHKAVRPGMLTSGLAYPWQADYVQCEMQHDIAWWPASRPRVTAGGAKWDDPVVSQQWHIIDRDTKLTKETLMNMREKWFELGFVFVRDGAIVDEDGS